jgi:hypothetical protein
MAEAKSSSAPKKKGSGSIAGSILDGVGWVIGQAVLPVPDFLFEKKKKKDEKAKKK